MKNMSKKEMQELIESLKNEIAETQPANTLAQLYKGEMPYRTILHDNDRGFYYGGSAGPHNDVIYRGELWNCLMTLAKQLFLVDCKAYIKERVYVYGRYRSNVEVESDTIRNIRKMSRAQQNLAVEMMEEIAQVFNKYFKLANPEVFFNGQVYPVNELEIERGE